MARTIAALTVRQWLPTWNDADFSANEFRSRPPEHFYLMSVPAGTLRSLVGIYRRSAKGGKARSRDLGIQRAHDHERSDEIREYVKYGFPWSSLSAKRRREAGFRDLVKPGWLPTAVVVNILTDHDERDGKSVDPEDLLRVTGIVDGIAQVELPVDGDSNWRPSALPPLEVIDGQHRLWAFDDGFDDYELPVVAFHGLDRSWQAYLFYTINIKPKRINTSLAFDLYPLLRTEDWLERFEGHSVYRETRAQELTEALWAHSASPWHDRINMLGERGTRSVTQASWIRSLTATIVKAWEGQRVQIGGLFGAPVGGHRLVLPWNRAQQAAFLIFAWQELSKSVAEINSEWATVLREDGESDSAAFDGGATMINSDIGVRGYLYVVNDLCYLRADHLQLAGWEAAENSEATSEVGVSEALKSLRKLSVATFVSQLAEAVADYDWRSSKAPGLTEDQRQRKARFRGGTGYRELRADLLRHLASGSGEVASAAQDALAILEY